MKELVEYTFYIGWCLCRVLIPVCLVMFAGVWYFVGWYQASCVLVGGLLGCLFVTGLVTYVGWRAAD